MRILIVSRYFPPDVHNGLATVAWNAWDRLRQRHEVRLVAGWTRDSVLLPGDARAVQVDPARPLRSRLAVDLAARREALRFHPDAVLAAGIEVPSDLAPTVGLLTDPKPGAENWGRLKELRRAFWRRRTAAMAAAVVPTEAARERMIRFGLDPGRLRVAAPGIDVTRLKPDEDIPPLPGRGEPIRLIYAARMLPSKGQHVAVEAVKGLPERLRERVVLDLVGPADDPAYVTTLQRRARGVDVTFHHDVPDVAPFFRRAHIALFPSTGEEFFGYSALDAMASGKPVVYSRSPALDEATGGIGIPVAAGDVKQLGLAIRALAKDPEGCADLGRRGRAYVLEHHAWDRAAARYEALLEEAAGV